MHASGHASWQGPSFSMSASDHAHGVSQLLCTDSPPARASPQGFTAADAVTAGSQMHMHAHPGSVSLRLLLTHEQLIQGFNSCGNC